MTDQSGTSGDNHGSPANNTDNSSASMKWNRNHSAIRRIMAELRDLERNPSPDFRVHTFESNLFEIHFTVRGPEDTDFAGGVYHGRIILPENYPYKAPDIVLMTPNGRFEVNKKICLSITSYHQETWSPSWGIRTMLIALQGFLPTKAEGIGSLEYSSAKRKTLARQSLKWRCPECGTVNGEVLPKLEKKEEKKEVVEKKEEEEASNDQEDGQDDQASSGGADNGEESVRGVTVASDVVHADRALPHGEPPVATVRKQVVEKNQSTSTSNTGDPIRVEPAPSVPLPQQQESGGTLRRRVAGGPLANGVQQTESSGTALAQRRPVSSSDDSEARQDGEASAAAAAPTAQSQQAVNDNQRPDTTSLDRWIAAINMIIVVLISILCWLLYDRLW